MAQATSTARPTPETRENRTRSLWILGPYTDLVLVIGSPLIVYALLSGAQFSYRAESISAVVMIWAIGHHLPGMMRAYGDPELFARFRVRFILAPLFLIFVSYLSYVFGLNGLQALAGVWGWWHYMMQTYGFVRIYDSKVRSFNPITRWLDQAMCFTWFGAAILLNDNALFGFANSFYNCGVPILSPDSFATLQTVVSVVTILVTTAFAVNWLWRLRAGDRPNPIKLLLMATTFAYFWYSTATVTQIVVAYAFFEVFHDVQYLTIVWAFNRNRVTKDASLGGFTRFLFRPRMALVILYLALVFAYGSLDYASKLINPGSMQQFLFGCFLASVLLHYYFDGFIWKLREKKTQSTFDIESADDRPNEIRSPPSLQQFLLWSAFTSALLGLTYTEFSKRVREANEDAETMRERIVTDSKTMAEIMPGSFMAQFYAGLAHEVGGDYSAAKARYERALAVWPEYGDAMAGLQRIRANEPARLPIERPAENNSSNAESRSSSAQQAY